MKAIAWTKYGSAEVLKVIETSKPVPKTGEVLVKIQSSTVTAGDVRLRACRVPIGFWLPTRLVFGLFKPRKTIPGMEFSGVIEAIGNDVKLFAIGDEVYGTAGMHFGAYAEYMCISEKEAFVKKPNGATSEEAVAAIFGGLTAIHFLKDKAAIKKGQSILINGASGAVGSASIQVAKYLGAKITGVCSTANIDLVKSLGAESVIDYTKNNINEMTTRQNTETYDFILDTVGNLSLSSCKNILKTEGKLISINAGLFTNLLSLFNKNLICGVAGESKQNLEFLKKLIETGNMKPVIDRIYALDEIVEAHRYVDLGHKKGNVVVSIFTLIRRKGVAV
ncbi:NAD(P)-dependent alcohol dehydrogenase [uncultured Cocleimonas sp.]|uniref:NAD(P)-dependent alcohol dehydrogenase n=1 Tax=uncultured Cocleimonas sp. TaxID=1051587 RepID=UPI0026389BEF|nr:NAD(P)-dependent alcohol dehydrogenase [uncultured Cocleimonas sp.]